MNGVDYAKIFKYLNGTIDTLKCGITFHQASNVIEDSLTRLPLSCDVDDVIKRMLSRGLTILGNCDGTREKYTSLDYSLHDRRIYKYFCT